MSTVAERRAQYLPTSMRHYYDVGLPERLRAFAEIATATKKVIVEPEACSRDPRTSRRVAENTGVAYAEYHDYANECRPPRARLATQAYAGKQVLGEQLVRKAPRPCAEELKASIVDPPANGRPTRSGRVRRYHLGHRLRGRKLAEVRRRPARYDYPKFLRQCSSARSMLASKHWCSTEARRGQGLPSPGAGATVLISAPGTGRARGSANRASRATSTLRWRNRIEFIAEFHAAEVV